MNARDVFAELVAANRAGARRGLPSWCTAHPQTLKTVLSAYRDNEEPILIEATCNQVNQDGGYTGMRPADFRRMVEALARDAGIDRARLMLGGDHLGPNPWKHLPAREAMARACELTKAYVEAGFVKLHLDASMACGDEDRVAEATIAARAATLCAAAEAADPHGGCVYVIGTEVPIPGGELAPLEAIAVTAPGAARGAYEQHKTAFAAQGVSSTWDRVIALVVQPGVDMGNDQVFDFNAAKAARLSAAVTQIPGVVYEAHSTDYQTEAALAELVASHFAILKVGPMLTFAFREAVFALAAIENQMKPSTPSGVVETLEGAMEARPEDWRGYVARDGSESVTRLYGLSDRIRYYWAQPAVQSSLRQLFANIDAGRPPLGLVSQYVGAMLRERREPTLSQRVVAAKVDAVVGRYRRACGGR